MRLFRKSNYRVKELKNGTTWPKVVGVCAVLLLLSIGLTALLVPKKGEANQSDNNNESSLSQKNDQDRAVPIDDGIYKVEAVIDGDTFKTYYKDELVSVRIIGVNTPEIATADTPGECYGEEARNYLKQSIEGRLIILSIDPSQDDRDKYGRLLRHVGFDDGTNVAYSIISEGYGYEYTYETPHYYQQEYRDAEDEARRKELGMWGSGVCMERATTTTPPSVSTQTPTASTPQQNKTSCVIKGNISYYGGKKIYHVPGQKYYDETIINEAMGERWFCSEEEAQAAGWRRSKE